jgi:hypothetical protein
VRERTAPGPIFYFDHLHATLASAKELPVFLLIPRTAATMRRGLMLVIAAVIILLKDEIVKIVVTGEF